MLISFVAIYINLTLKITINVKSNFVFNYDTLYKKYKFLMNTVKVC